MHWVLTTNIARCVVALVFHHASLLSLKNDTSEVDVTLLKNLEPVIEQVRHSSTTLAIPPGSGGGVKY